MAKASRQGLSKLTTAKERIKRFLTDGDISLSAEEVGILQRWEFTDRLMMQGNTITSLLRVRIQDEFSVSVTTADSDIFSAQEVFGEVSLTLHLVANYHCRTRTTKAIGYNIPLLAAVPYLVGK